LYPQRMTVVSRRGDKDRDECFGLPNGGAVCGLVFGAIVIIAGLAWYFHYDWNQLWNTALGPFLVIVIGLLIVAGAIYGMGHRRS
jgi:tetrahydromethanopterin S-methyltransferase subunit E